MARELRVFTGSAHPALGESICRFLGVPLGRAHLARFSDGEVWFQTVSYTHLTLPTIYSV